MLAVMVVEGVVARALKMPKAATHVARNSMTTIIFTASSSFQAQQAGGGAVDLLIHRNQIEMAQTILN